MMKKYLSLAAIVALYATNPVYGQQVSNGPDGKPAYVEGEVIVKYKDGAQRVLHRVVSAYERLNVVNVQRFSGVFKNFEHLVFDKSKLNLEQVMADLERDPDVEYVQPNYLLYSMEELEEREDVSESNAVPCRIPGIPYPPGCGNTGTKPPANPPPPSVTPQPTNPSLASLTLPARGNRPGLRAAPAAVNPPKADPSLNQLWGVRKIGADKVWPRQKGSKNVIVAVIDSGVDYNHPDLAANIWRNPNYRRLQATGVDVEGLSVSGDLVGWNFVHNDNLPWDDRRHGTHVAGTIGAVGGNGIGISGVAQNVSIMPIKFLNSSGSGATSAAIKSIDYAISRGAKILNNSWGSKGGQNRALMDAIQRSERAGTLFIAAAGNNGTDNDRSPVYPASYTFSNMISVAATTSTDGLASYSNRGLRTVHMGAPGTSIYSTVPNGKYMSLSGTSMATPHVAGAAALIWSQYPNLTYRQVKERLINTGDLITSLRGRTISGRRLNVQKAMAAQ